MRRNHGFTITELMIAVVIIGVLASLAIPGFTSYIYKARVTEATNFLGEVKQRQESYRNEFGQYCDVSASITSFYPSTLPGADPVTWDSASAGNWNHLGATPDGPIRFQYSTIAGFPGDTPPANTPVDAADHWFIGRARGDLDEDGTDFYLEIYSQTNQIYNSVGGKGGWR